MQVQIGVMTSYNELKSKILFSSIDEQRVSPPVTASAGDISFSSCAVKIHKKDHFFMFEEYFTEENLGIFAIPVDPSDMETVITTLQNHVDFGEDLLLEVIKKLGGYPVSSTKIKY